MIKLGDKMIKKKRKVKVKKTSYFLLLGITFLIVILILLGNKKEPVKTLSPEEEKYQKLDNIQTKIDYFNKNYLDRYLAYKEKNKGLSTTQIIKDVNMNLDQEWYQNPSPAKNLNTPLVLVNKYYYLEDNYIPDNLEEISTQYALKGMQLVKEAKDSFEELAKEARKEDLKIIAMSTYRSYDYQVNLYNQYVKKDGQKAADTYSGRPGHSEHQTGLAVDVYNGVENYTNFEKTEEYQWMQKHAHEYGFIVRFPKEKEKETGYEFESWHYRYVGKEIASYIKENNITLEEYIATKTKDW